MNHTGTTTDGRDRPNDGRHLFETALPAGDAVLSSFCLTLDLEAVVTVMWKLTTTVSTRGQVIIPKGIRERRRWSTGTELIVEETPEGVLLKAKPAFAASQPEDVFGSLPYGGPAKSIAEMNAAISREAKRRRARHRY